MLDLPVLLVSLVCSVLFCSYRTGPGRSGVRSRPVSVLVFFHHQAGHRATRCPMPGLMTVSIPVEDYDRLAVDVRSIMALDGDLIGVGSSECCSSLSIGQVLGM